MRPARFVRRPLAAAGFLGTRESLAMKVLAASLGALAVVATLGLVTAQDQPPRESDPAGGGQPATATGREPDARAITDLLASFVKAYNAKDARVIGDLFTPDAEIEDEDGEIT